MMFSAEITLDAAEKCVMTPVILTVLRKGQPRLRRAEMHVTIAESRRAAPSAGRCRREGHQGHVATRGARVGRSPARASRLWVWCRAPPPHPALALRGERDSAPKLGG